MTLHCHPCFHCIRFPFFSVAIPIIYSAIHLHLSLCLEDGVFLLVWDKGNSILKHKPAEAVYLTKRPFQTNPFPKISTARPCMYIMATAISIMEKLRETALLQFVLREV